MVQSAKGVNWVSCNSYRIGAQQFQEGCGKAQEGKPAGEPHIEECWSTGGRIDIYMARDFRRTNATFRPLNIDIGIMTGLRHLHQQYMQSISYAASLRRRHAGIGGDRRRYCRQVFDEWGIWRELAMVN